MCAVCNGIIYRKTVTELQQSKHNIHNFFTRKKSFDDKEYFRKTCNSKLSKGCIPRQAVCRTRMSGKTWTDSDGTAHFVWKKIVVMP